MALGPRRSALGGRELRHGRRSGRCAIALLFALVFAPAALGGQVASSSGRAVETAPRVLPELRIDAIEGARDRLHLGLGGVVPLGTYARAALIVGGGAARADGEARGSARAEGLVRFLLDPLRERRWGVYGGAGVSAGWIDGDGWRAGLVIAVGIEGRARGGHALAAELGLGDGARVGVVVRRTRAGRR
ncbi:MAG TPA: hypothetical protein VFZ11_05745 [Gemmatimonadaceae bacterium]